MKIRKREIGIDLVKTIACYLVVALHTIRVEVSGVNFVIFAFAVVAIPLFFMVNGYLMFRKEQIPLKYVGKKVIRILSVCFCWEALHGMAYFLYYRQFRNVFESFVLDFFQKGLFFHFWFMGALIILYICMPFLRRLYDHSQKIYIGILLCLGGICVLIDIIMIVTKNQFVLNIPQNLRLWYWLFYYMLGGLVSKKKEKIIEWISRISWKVKTIILVTNIFIVILWQKIIGYVVVNHYVIESFYGCIPVIVLATIIFMYILEIKSFKYDKVVTYLAGLSMGIYIVHPFLLAILKKFVPAFVEGNFITNILFWILTVVISGIVSAVIRAIPYVRELIKL